MKTVRDLALVKALWLSVQWPWFHVRALPVGAGLTFMIFAFSTMNLPSLYFWLSSTADSYRAHHAHQMQLGCKQQSLRKP